MVCQWRDQGEVLGVKFPPTFENSLLINVLYIYINYLQKL